MNLLTLLTHELRPRHAMHVLNFDRRLGAVLSFCFGRFHTKVTGNPMLYNGCLLPD